MTTIDEAQRRATHLMGRHLPGWSFGFDHARSRIGCCHHAERRITLSRNLVGHLSVDEVDQVVLHEIAHALAGPKVGHGPAWRRRARALGYTGQRTMPVPEARQQARWRASCPRGHEYLRHRRPSRQSFCGPCMKQGDSFELDWQDQRANG